MNIGNLVHFFFDAPGPGGVVIIGVILLAIVIYVVLTRWIIAGGRQPASKMRKTLR